MYCEGAIKKIYTHVLWDFNHYLLYVDLKPLSINHFYQWDFNHYKFHHCGLKTTGLHSVGLKPPNSYILWTYNHYFSRNRGIITVFFGSHFYRAYCDFSSLSWQHYAMVIFIRLRFVGLQHLESIPFSTGVLSVWPSVHPKLSGQHTCASQGDSLSTLQFGAAFSHPGLNTSQPSN